MELWAESGLFLSLKTDGSLFAAVWFLANVFAKLSQRVCLTFGGTSVMELSWFHFAKLVLVCHGRGTDDNSPFRATPIDILLTPEMTIQEKREAK